MEVLGSITGEGFTSTIHQDLGRVLWMADADVDADGANGQNGKRAAYMVNDKGSELLANGGMAMRDGRVICAHSWARDVVLLGVDGEPMIFSGGIVASTTWYRYLGKKANDPAAYVDSETVCYIVVPPLIIQHTAGIVRGCRGRMTYSGQSVECVVADKGPRNRIGEASIAACRAVGLDANPRSGGTEKPEVLYEIWPGEKVPGFDLQPS